MADIAMCRNKDCPQKDSCYRYTAPINMFGQAVFTEKYSQPCKWFWDNTGYIDGRKIGKWWKK